MAHPPRDDTAAASGRARQRARVRDWKAYAMSAGAGLLLWLATALVSGKAEAWDAGLYWKLAYPLALVASAWLGYRFPRGAWRWPLSVMLAQAAALVVGSAQLDLLPPGLLMFAVLALPGVVLALLAARHRRRHSDRPRREYRRDPHP